ncbi:MAG: amidohydrolase family protein [Thermoleophilia bacterium]|jgi:hypothetical protein
MIVDFHTHIFPPEIIASRTALAEKENWFGQLYGDAAARMATAEELIAEMDRCGIDMSVVCGFGFESLDVCAACNTYAADAVQRWPDRIAGFATVPPLASGAIRELERAVSLGLTGIGELMPDGAGFDLADTASLEPLTGFAAAHRLPLLVHLSEPLGREYPGKGTATPDKGLAFASANPDLTIVFAHWGGGLPFYEQMWDVRAALASVYYDCAASPFLYDADIYGVAARILGAKKILFGSDFPLISPERYLRDLDAAGLEPAAIEAIMGANAAALLGGDRR